MSASPRALCATLLILVALACTSPEPAPAPTATSAAPASAPAEPTAAPTDTPPPTATPDPTATPTPEPTATATPMPTPTPTPEPTATPTPTPTPLPTLAPGEPTRTPTPTPPPTPTPAPIDTLTPADLPGLLPSVSDIAGLATETAQDSPVIKNVTLAGVCEGLPASECAYREVKGETEFSVREDGFIAGYKRYTWAGGLLNVYSVSGSRAYFTFTWVSLYDTPEQAKAIVDQLKAYDRRALNDETDELIAELRLPVRGVNIISVADADAPPLGDYAAGKEYAFSGSTAIIEGREIRFVRGRTAVRAIVAGVFGKTHADSTLALAQIVESNLEPFILRK